MRTIERVFDKTYYPEFLGMEGEESATTLVVDVHSVLAYQPDSIFSVKIQRADGQQYVGRAVVEADENGKISYSIQKADTSVKGELQIQVTAIATGYSEMSKVFQFIVVESLVSSQAIPPDTLAEIIQYTQEAYEHMVNASAAASFLSGIQLLVDVTDGVLELYAEGEFSPIDIRANGQYLEVWQIG